MEFKLITRADYVDLQRWLQQPHIARWWADDSSLEGIDQMYGGCVDGNEPSEVFIAFEGDRKIGLIQRYSIAAYPEHVEELRGIAVITPGTYSIDYLIGEQTETGMGKGTQMIREFVEKLWRDKPEAKEILVPIHVENVASGRVLEKNGFSNRAHCQLKPDNPKDSREHFIYLLWRPNKPSI